MTRIDSNPDDATTFVRASHAIDLNLPAAASLDMNSARQAIRRELRDSAKWKRLRIRQVRQASESAQGIIYELQVGHAVEFDWTWEGAVAFRPLLLTEFESSQATRFTNGSLDPAIDDSILWSGEVLEVDEATGRIFVIVTDPEHPPTRGSFYVRPFEFLSFLDAVYNEPAFEPMRKLLPPRLAASLGGIHPEVLTSDHAEPSDHSEPVGLPELQTWWRKSWSILWGPPGTGKTYTTGQQVAAVLADPTERILILSSTNRATDAVATAIGHSIKHQNVSNHGDALQSLSAVRRIGKGASYRRFDQAGLTDLLQGTETEFLSRIENLGHDLARSADSVKKAVIRQQIKATRGQMQDAAKRNFLDARVRVVIGTAFMATSFLNRQEVREDLELERAPFTTVIIDEAGLMSRVIIAALSLLASRRVILVGDSKQLAPISRISRILEPGQGNWLARSGLGHLDKIHEHPTGVHVLSRQYRMHPDVCQVVSAFQYDGQLSTAPEVLQRPSPLPRLFQNQPRAMWYVLDEETHDLPTIRADRGPGNRSWVRPITLDILRRLFSDSSLAKTKGLFISPFNAQAKLVHTFFASADIKSWMSSTVHSQQGSEADIVIFDTVNAGSYGWAYDDWKRLINVGLSRAREAILLLASRAEMEEPYLRPLLQYMAPRVLRQQGSQLHWQPVSAQTRFRLPQVRESSAEYVVGHQLSQRKQLEPVLSHEQQRLCGLKLDGKPRLVRGVAGSGKTVVLAHWLMQTVQRLAREADVRIWAVFANRSLQTLIGDSIESAWRQATGGKSFPWHRVELHHVREILSVMLPEAGLSIDDYQFDYDEAAKAYLSRRSHQDITPRCHAMFVDEAQDMGAHTLKLLAAIVWQSETTDENSRAINIFYDNAQNIYGRPTPKWSDLGLDMRGRSSVMKESFRSTRPITELALNVLYRLQPPHSNPDHKELVARGLIEREPQSAIEWWRVRFNQVAGPTPEWQRFMTLDQEFTAIGETCRQLIVHQQVQPEDICILYNGKNLQKWLIDKTQPVLADLGIELSIQTNRPFKRHSHMLLATTAHSFKGYDSEIVIVAGVDQFRAEGTGILANSLYVAMTRARSILKLFSRHVPEPEVERLSSVMEQCLGYLTTAPTIDRQTSLQDDLLAVLDQIGLEHRAWLEDLWQRFEISQEPIVTDAGEIIAQPLFSFSWLMGHYACFGNQPLFRNVLDKLEEHQITVLAPGAPLFS